MVDFEKFLLCGKPLKGAGLGLAIRAEVGPEYEAEDEVSGMEQGELFLSNSICERRRNQRSCESVDSRAKESSVVLGNMGEPRQSSSLRAL